MGNQKRKTNLYEYYGIRRILLNMVFSTEGVIIKDYFSTEICLAMQQCL